MGEAARSREDRYPEGEFRTWAEQLWAEAKEIIVWLKLRGQDGA